MVKMKNCKFKAIIQNWEIFAQNWILRLGNLTYLPLMLFAILNRKEMSKKNGDAAYITVEAGDSIIPGNGVQLIQQSFPPKENFIGELKEASLSQLRCHLRI